MTISNKLVPVVHKITNEQEPSQPQMAKTVHVLGRQISFYSLDGLAIEIRIGLALLGSNLAQSIRLFYACHENRFPLPFTEYYLLPLQLCNL